MRFSSSYPYIGCIIKLNQPIFILKKLDFHAHNINPMHHLHVVSNLIAHFQTINSWIKMHQFFIIAHELLVIIVYISLKPLRKNLHHLFIFCFFIIIAIILNFLLCLVQLFDANWAKSELKELT